MLGIKNHNNLSTDWYNIPGRYYEVNRKKKANN